jgi:hypothetical protein
VKPKKARSGTSAHPERVRACGGAAPKKTRRRRRPDRCAPEEPRRAPTGLDRCDTSTLLVVERCPETGRHTTTHRTSMSEQRSPRASRSLLSSISSEHSWARPRWSVVAASRPSHSADAQHPAHRWGRVLSPHWECLLDYAFTSAPFGVWLGRSSSFSLVRRAWAKPSPTRTAMTAARANAAIAHQKAMAAIRLNP